MLVGLALFGWGRGMGLVRFTEGGATGLGIRFALGALSEACGFDSVRGFASERGCCNDLGRLASFLEAELLAALELFVEPGSPGLNLSLLRFASLLFMERLFDSIFFSVFSWGERNSMSVTCTFGVGGRIKKNASIKNDIIKEM